MSWKEKIELAILLALMWLIAVFLSINTLSKTPEDAYMAGLLTAAVAAITATTIEDLMKKEAEEK